MLERTMHPWKKIENQNGLPFYINELTKEKQWDHPKFSDIRQRLDDCNYVRYSSYRVALKFRVLQQALWMDHVPLSIVAAVFERHKLGANECSLNLDCYDLEAILYDIYFACNKKNESSIDVDASTELMLNLLVNVFDRDKTGKIEVLSSKVLLGIICCSTATIDLYRFLFELSADHNNCITRLKLHVLLKKITEIINFLHEDANFGQHLISSSTENCFIDSPGLVGITETTFISWLENGPSIISWLPILSRIKLAETVLHNMVCSACKIRPFVGLRYRCLKCVNYIQCQRCFFTGKTSSSHKLSHSMREYCAEATDKARSYIFMKKLFGFITCTSKKTIPDAAAVDTKPSGNDNEVFSSNSTDGETLCDITPLSSPLSQLQLVIRQLEQQNRELSAILSSGHQNPDELKVYLKNHRLQVSTQINKLKVLKEYLKLPSNTTSNDEKPAKVTLQSTPMVPSNGRNRHQKLEIDVLSPIAQADESSRVLYQTNSQVNPENGDRTFDIIRGTDEKSTMQYSFNDISTWIGGNPSSCPDFFSDRSEKVRGREMHTDLDDALAKLQQILANNFTLDESLGNYDNGHLKYTVSEVEGMLTSFIDTVETSKASSVQ